MTSSTEHHLDSDVAPPSTPFRTLDKDALDRRWSIINALSHDEVTMEEIAEYATDEDVYIRALVCSHSLTPPETLLTMARDYTTSIRVMVSIASNPSIGQRVAASLYELNNPSVDYQLVLNDSTPVSILSKIAERREFYACLALAQSRRTDPSILSELARTDNINVIRAAASNPNTPKSSLTQLASHENCLVRSAVASNPSSPEVAINTLLEDESNDVKAGLASNPNVPSDVLRELSHSDNTQILSLLLNNSNVDMDTVRALTHHRDKEVASQARTIIAVHDTYRDPLTAYHSMWYCSGIDTKHTKKEQN